MYCRHILPRLVFTASADADMARVDQAQRLIIEAMEAEPERPNLIEAVMALSGLLIAMIDRAQPDNDERRRLVAHYARAAFHVDMPAEGELDDDSADDCGLFG